MHKRMCWSGISRIFLVFFVTPALCIHKGYTEEHVAAAKQYLSQLKSDMELKHNFWADPNDMFANDYDPDMKLNSVNRNIKTLDETVKADVYRTLERKDENFNYLKTNQENCSKVCQIEMDKSILKNHMYLGRWLNMFLNKFSDSTLNGENKLISFPVNNLDLNKIQEMLNSKCLSIAAIDEIISGMMSEAIVSYRGNWISRTIDILLQNRIFLIMGISLPIFVVTYASPRLFIFISVSLVCLFWQWMLLYNKEMSKKQASVESIHFPDVCQTHKLGILGAIQFAITGFFVSKGTCEDYYRALLVDPFWEVTPMKVISGTISTFVLYPIEILSETINISILKLFKDLSYTSVIVILVFLIFVLMMMCNYRLRMPFLLSFEPSYAPIPPPSTSQVQAISTPSYLSSILQGAKNIASYLMDSDQVPVPASSTTSNNVSFVQKSEICDANVQHTDRILKCEYSPTAKLEILGFREGQEPEKLKWKIYSKVDCPNVSKLTINKSTESNEIKCLHEVFPCSSTSQVSELSSDNLPIVSPDIPKQNVKTEMQNIETEVQCMETGVDDVETEVRCMEMKDNKTRIKDMNVATKNIETDLTDMEIDITDVKSEMKDSYIQPAEKEMDGTNEISLSVISPGVLTCSPLPELLGMELSDTEFVSEKFQKLKLKNSS